MYPKATSSFYTIPKLKFCESWQIFVISPWSFENKKSLKKEHSQVQTFIETNIFLEFLTWGRGTNKVLVLWEQMTNKNI